MVIKVFVSSVSGNIEIKRKQDFVVTVLGGRKIQFEEIDIADAKNEEKKIFMRENAQPAGNDRVPLPPQIFSDDQYCGNYDSFLEANENDDLRTFLKLSQPGDATQHAVRDVADQQDGAEHQHEGGHDADEDQ